MEPGVVVTHIYNQMLAFLQSKTTVLVADGQDLATVLLLITLSWSVLLWLLTGDGPAAMMESVGTVLRYSIVVVLLTGWIGTVGGFFQTNLNDIASKVAGVSSIESATSAMFGAATDLFAVKRAAKLSPCVEIKDGSGASATSEVICQDTSTAKGAEPSFFDLLFNLPLVMFTMFLKGLALVFMLLLTVAFLLAVFMSEVLFGLAMALGPVLVPWLVWQRTEWLFDGWLRFMLAAVFTKIVALFMVGATAGLIVAARAAAAQVNVSNASDFLAVDEMAAFVVCIVAAIGAFMMWQVPSIAGALVGGGTGAASSGFGRGAMGKSGLAVGKTLGKLPGVQEDLKSARDWLGKKGGGDKS